jgi:glycosyltransferase involved in cell wall biosynthesis
VAHAIREHRATVVHAHHYSPFVYAALARLWRPRAHVIFTEHGRLSDEPPSAKRRWANRVLARLSSATVAVSADLRAHLTSEAFPERVVTVIYNGIDPGPPADPRMRRMRRDSLGISDDMLLVGTVARLDPVKNLATLIDAIGQVAGRRRAGLLVIGDGPERQALETIARESAVPAATRFLGHRDDAREWLAACDVYANSSVSEGVSLTILEAMAAGLPVVATAVGGTPEVVDESCGRLVPPRSARAMADAIMALAESPALRRDLGRAARARVEDRFTIDRMVADYRAVYERLG